MKKFAPYLIAVGILAGAGIPLYTFVIKPGGGSSEVLPVTGEDLPVLDESWPLHFCSPNVEQIYPMAEAIPNAGRIGEFGGEIETRRHPDYSSAQIRLIRLPKAIHATKKSAEVLAACGVIQDGDIMLVVRRPWAKANAYGNIQLGIPHSALSTIQRDEAGPFVHSVESPISYSTPLNHPTHHKGYDTFHVVRPNLTDKQKANVAKWGKLIVLKNNIKFQTDYGKPYAMRGEGRDHGSVGLNLAMNILFDVGPPLDAYCSELVWAVLSLRDIDPEEVKEKYPTPDEKGDEQRYLASRLNPLFDPLPGMTKDPVKEPGLMQGPGTLLRQVIPSIQARRQFMLDNVLLTRDPVSTESKALMSSSHIETAVTFMPKVLQMRQWFGPQKESMSELKALNIGLAPNYSPTIYSALANSQHMSGSEKTLKYVGTVTFDL